MSAEAGRGHVRVIEQEIDEGPDEFEPPPPLVDACAKDLIQRWPDANYSTWAARQVAKTVLREAAKVIKAAQKPANPRRYPR